MRINKSALFSQVSPAAGGPPPLPAALIWKVLLLLFSAIRTSSSRWMANDIQQNSFGRMRFLFLSPLPIDFLSLLLQLQLCEHVQDRHAELQHRLSTSKHTDSHGNFRFGSRIIPPFIQWHLNAKSLPLQHGDSLFWYLSTTVISSAGFYTRFHLVCVFPNQFIGSLAEFENCQRGVKEAYGKIKLLLARTLLEQMICKEVCVNVNRLSMTTEPIRGGCQKSSGNCTGSWLLWSIVSCRYPSSTRPTSYPLHCVHH